jgi:hypothetical protein
MVERAVRRRPGEVPAEGTALMHDLIPLGPTLPGALTTAEIDATVATGTEAAPGDAATRWRRRSCRSAPPLPSDTRGPTGYPPWYCAADYVPAPAAWPNGSCLACSGRRCRSAPASGRDASLPPCPRETPRRRSTARRPECRARHSSRTLGGLICCNDSAYSATHRRSGDGPCRASAAPLVESSRNFGWPLTAGGRCGLLFHCHSHSGPKRDSDATRFPARSTCQISRPQQQALVPPLADQPSNPSRLSSSLYIPETDR